MLFADDVITFKEFKNLADHSDLQKDLDTVLETGSLKLLLCLNTEERVALCNLHTLSHLAHMSTEC